LIIFLLIFNNVQFFPVSVVFETKWSYGSGLFYNGIHIKEVKCLTSLVHPI